MRLYIGNLPWLTEEDQLRAAFAQYGEVSFLQIPTGRQGRSRGYGIVEFANDQDALNAIPHLNGTMIGDRAITVREDKVGPTAPGGQPNGTRAEGAGNAKRANRSARQTPLKGAPAMDGCRCYLGNLSWTTTNEELMQHCSMAAGPAVTAAQVAYQKSGRSKGWGLVDFATPADAENAIGRLHNSELGGRAIICRLERPPTENGAGDGNNGGGKQKTRSNNAPERTGTSSGCQVVVRNLPWATNSMDLREVFQQVGTVIEAEAVTHADTGRSKGWGTVRFATPMEAESAVQGFSGIPLSGREMQVKIDRFA